MSTEIVMPKLSDTMEEGKILRWFKRPGDSIHRGEAIAEVETDKADMVLESFDDGVLDEIRLKEGDSAPVGAVIATMRSSAAAAGASESEQTAGRSGDERGAGTAEDSRAAEKPALRAVERDDKPAPRISQRRARRDSTPPQEPAAARPSLDDAEISPDFHPAMSAHPSAAPTGIPMPPARAL
ncbi:MAG: biotin/lipoyl-containing protein, partial [Candidatus Binataceae bacterium]